jgi:ABC-type transport system involved in multi-copper enzyme maturation permease subunit
MSRNEAVTHPPVPDTGPDLGQAAHALWRLVWKTRLTARRLPRMVILLAILPVLALITSSDSPIRGFLMVALNYHLGIVLPLVCLIQMAAPIRDEAEQGTLPFLATRPLPRTTFFLLLHGCHLLWLEIIFLVAGLLLLAVGSYLEIPDITGMIAPFLLAQAGAVLAFSGLSALIGLLTRRYLLLGLLYGSVIEVGIGGIPTNINVLSLSHHVRVIVSVYEPTDLFLRGNSGNPLISGLVLIATGVIAAVLAALIYSVREFAGGPDT